MITKVTILIQLATAVSSPNSPVRHLGGWSESFYNGSSYAPTMFAQTVTLCAARAQLLPTGATIVGQRYQVVNPAGISSSTANVYPGSAGLLADVPQMALLFRVPSNNTRNVRPVILRGTPDARIVEGEYVPSGTYTSALSAFFLQLSVYQWQFRGLNLDAPQAPLFSIDNLGNYTAISALPFVGGELVKVLRATDSNGDRYGASGMIKSVATTKTGQITPWTGGVTTGGVIRQTQIVFPVFAPFTPGTPRVVVKKVGRPFGQYRGRHSRAK